MLYNQRGVCECVIFLWHWRKRYYGMGSIPSHNPAINHASRDELLSDKMHHSTNRFNSRMSACERTRALSALT